MPGSTTTSASNLLAPVVDATIEQAVWRNVDSLTKHFEKRTIPGDPSWRWNVNSTGNVSAELYSEGQAPPAAGSQGYARAAIPILDFRVAFGYSGQLQRALESDAARYADAIREEIVGAEKDMRDLITNTLLGTGSNGLDLAVDSSGTYAGISHASAFWQSQEVALGGALTIAFLEDLREVAMDNDIGARPDLDLCPLNQVTNYNRLAGPGASTSLVRYHLEPGQVASTNLGSDVDTPRFGGQAIAGVPDMTDTLWYMLQRGDFWIREQKAAHIEEKAEATDGKVFHLMTHVSLICKSPKMQSKGTGVTA